jgi:L-aminopeptidase/D-esterase-like protein
VSLDLAPWGLAVGHATDAGGATGLTVIRGVERAFHASVAVLGRATGTRELHTLSPNHLVDRVDAILLTGGSAYGLDAAAGAMRWMEQRRRGFPVGDGVVPIVPAAVIFDLAPLGQFTARPTADMAYAACEDARADRIAEGSVGVGTGATVGTIAGRMSAMKGGFGCSIARGGKVSVAAMAVVNAAGDVRGADGSIIAGARRPEGGFADVARLAAEGALTPSFRHAVARHTTLAVVAALYRRITPVGTSLDGDVVFAACPIADIGEQRVRPSAPHVEALAVQALESAIERAVRTARGRDGIPGLADGPA